MEPENTDTQAPESPPGGLSVDTKRAGAETTITVAGELDPGTAGTLERAIREAEESDVGRIVVDLRDLTFIDSTGLELLLTARRRSSDGRLSCIASKHDTVARVIALTDTGAALGFPSD